VNVSATALTALAAAGRELNQSAEAVRRSSLPNPDEDSVDLSQAAVQLLTARTGFRVAVELAKAADEVAEASLDLLA